MNWLDYVILVILVISVLGGLATGLIKAVLSLAGLIVGIILAGRFYPVLAGPISSLLTEGVAKVVAFIIILAVVGAIAVILGNILTKVVSGALLGWLNRLLGGVLGLIMGGITVAAFLAIWVKFLGIAGAISDSSLASFLLDKFPVVLALLPEEFDAVRRFFGSGRIN